MQTRSLPRLLVLASLACSLTLQAPAQAPPAPQIPGFPPGASSATPPRPDGYPALEEVIKDLKRADGLFTIFYAEPSDRTREPERLLALIPHRLLGQDLLLATSLSRGGYFTSWMWDDYLFRLEVRGRQLALVLPEVRYPTKGDEPVSEVIQKTYNARILATTPILSLSPAGEPVVDLGTLLKSDLAAPPLGGGIRAELSKWIRREKNLPAKVFSKNILIEVELAVGSGQGMSLLGVAYDFHELPPLGSYQPRLADDRVGYFLTARRDWTKKHDARDTFDRYINRWNLQKKDPSLELSPPVKPIKFIIEKTVPIQWRRYVRQGIEVWNRAYEKIGFTGAIEVFQQTHDNELKDVDPEDAEWNFFRWIVSGQPFAMGPSRTDPRTGQILDADIICDDSMIRSWIEDFATFTPRAVAEAKGPGFREYQRLHPGFRIPGAEALEEQASEVGLSDEARRTIEAKFAARGQSFCDHSIGFQHQIALGYQTMALRAGNLKIPEKLIGEAIRELVAHEVGHALGLRHNFKASSWLTLEEIQRRRSTEEPLSGSVMDYNPLLLLPRDRADGSLRIVSPTIGPYDYWAIEYGYKVRGPADKGEEEMLAAIAGRCAEPGLAYATDEDTMWVFSPDPLVNRWDMGGDPFRWAQERIALTEELLARVGEVAAIAGESRYHLTRAFETLLWEKATVLDLVARWVGGQHFHRDHEGDPSARAPFVLVPAERQRSALKLLKETVFRDAFFAFSPDLLNKLAPPRWSHWG
ncbi:MAG: zinc-dependent metalloprotease, partial [Thermoanaerobaculia bacterium]